MTDEETLNEVGIWKSENTQGSH